MSLACWTVSLLGTNSLVPSPVHTRRTWLLNAQVYIGYIHIYIGYTITYAVRSSQTLTSVLRTMEGATRPVPTLSGTTSAVAGVAIYSTRMDEAVIVSIIIVL